MLCRVSMYRIVATLLYIPSDLAWNVLEPYTSEAAAMWHSRHCHDMTFHTMPQCSFRFRYNVGDILCHRCSMQTPSSKIRFLSRRGQIWVSAKHDPRWKFPNNWLICVAPQTSKIHPKAVQLVSECNSLLQNCDRRRLFVVLGVLMRQGRDIGSHRKFFFFWNAFPFPGNFQHRLADGLRVPSMLNQCVV